MALLLLPPSALPAAAPRQTGPESVRAQCRDAKPSRQLDFWLGEWDVAASSGQKVAKSRIRGDAGGCVILESYGQADGYTGRSFNFYDTALGKWRQTWVDSAGNVSEFAGEYRDGAMRFEGESHRRDGQRVLRRMQIFNLGAGAVRQYSEASTDGGKTWAVLYDFSYTRRNSNLQESEKR